MAEILHHQGWWLSHYIFIGFHHHPRWLFKISAINSITQALPCVQVWFFAQSPSSNRTLDDLTATSRANAANAEGDFFCFIGAGSLKDRIFKDGNDFEASASFRFFCADHVIEYRRKIKWNMMELWWLNGACVILGERWRELDVCFRINFGAIESLRIHWRITGQHAIFNVIQIGSQPQNTSKYSPASNLSIKQLLLTVG